MRGWEIMKETLLRRRFVILLHLVFLGFYGIAALPVFSHQPEVVPVMLIVVSGCLVPLIISAGILGDDMASGRIALLVTKPMRTAGLYLWRFAGLAAQGLIHFLLAMAVITLIMRLTEAGQLPHCISLLFLGFLLFCSWTALSMTVSVVIKREFNSVLLIGGSLIILAFLGCLREYWPGHWVTVWYEHLLTYGYPPVKRVTEALGKTPAAQAIEALHILGLTAVYAGIGIFLLSRRQFPQARD